MLYNDLKTRDDFYRYVNEEINFNIYDMSDGELKVTQKYCKFVDFYANLNVELPKCKSQLNSIIHFSRRYFEKCLQYLLIPDNASADLTLRTLTENLIILKFLLTHNYTYTRK